MFAISSLLSSFTAATPATSSQFEKLPSGFIPYDQFVQQFALGKASTEQAQQQTKALSQTLQSDVVQGLRMLLEADREVLAGLERFTPMIESLGPQVAARLQSGGRIFLVGSGSSGRVAVDLAAKCSRVQIRGVIAGGDSAMIRAKEGFEDSEKDGEQCLQKFDLNEKDMVFLLSSSGSASFNVGCGHFAANRGVRVFYFYNSKEIPARTQQLFSRINNPVQPLELDIGPQAIAGSTRLQGASLAQLCLGALLGTALGNSGYPQELLEKMREGNRLIEEQIEMIADFVKQEAAIFSSANANFRRLRDETAQGYVTFVGEENTLREILIDATETSPTFSTNPIRREGEIDQKRAEFGAYLVGEQKNRAAWKALLGRDVESDGAADADQFLLAAEASGNHSYGNRPTGAGNFVIGVAKTAHPADVSDELLQKIVQVLEEGGDAGMIVLSRLKGFLPSPLQGRTLLLEGVPSDDLGIVETVLLKQILNLISNGSMVLMNKVHGNRMIDVRASNKKLIDRCHRLIQEIWGDSGSLMPLSNRELYHWIAHVSDLKKGSIDAGIYTPSVVKIVLAMLHLKKTPTPEAFQEVVRFLADRQERLDFLESAPKYTLCIDGGGSKTLLQILDSKGQIVPIHLQGRVLEGIEAGASNINLVKKEGVKAVLSDLFTDVKIGPNKRALSELLPSSRVIAGMAGVSLPENLKAVSSLFAEFGIRKEQLLVLTDAELALRLLKGNGVVLISGTGSICFAEKGGVRHRVGGLGRILGDEGSGYQIGLAALRAGLAEEYGYGASTRLSSALKAFFKVAELKSLFPQINSLEMSAAQIASAAPLVFECAEAKDSVAMGIIARAAEDLRQLVATALKIAQLKNSELHLWGGVFKGRFADPILKKIREETDPRGIKIVNRSEENAAVIFARTFPE